MRPPGPPDPEFSKLIIVVIVVICVVFIIVALCFYAKLCGWNTAPIRRDRMVYGMTAHGGVANGVRNLHQPFGVSTIQAAQQNATQQRTFGYDCNSMNSSPKGKLNYGWVIGDGNYMS